MDANGYPGVSIDKDYIPGPDGIPLPSDGSVSFLYLMPSVFPEILAIETGILIPFDTP